MTQRLPTPEETEALTFLPPGEITFAIGAPDASGKRLVRAEQDGEILSQERFDVFQAWQGKKFFEKTAGNMRHTSRFESWDAAVEFVKFEFDEAVRRLPVNGEAETKSLSSPVLVNLDTVESKEIAWLWPNRFALGKLSLVIGDPGNGKSFWSLDTAARISTGCKWPDDCGHAPLGSVILMGVEDDLTDTVKPRLEAAGADVSKIIALTGVANKDDAGEYERTVDLRRDIPVIESAIQQLIASATDGAVPRAIIIDPISAFLGKTDSHVNAEVRETLAPLAQLAEKYGVAIIAISHLRKSETSALHRVMGSVAFVAACRSCWAIAKDKRDPEGRRRLLLAVKSNISEDHGGLAFVLAADPEAVDCSNPRHYEAKSVGRKHRSSCSRTYPR